MAKILPFDYFKRTWNRLLCLILASMMWKHVPCSGGRKIEVNVRPTGNLARGEKVDIFVYMELKHEQINRVYLTTFYLQLSTRKERISLYSNLWYLCFWEKPLFNFTGLWVQTSWRGCRKREPEEQLQRWHTDSLYNHMMTPEMVHGKR